MDHSTRTHDLKTLVLSYHPLVVIETVEENRVRTLLRSAAAAVGMPLFEWTIARGLARLPNQGSVPGTGEPLHLLKHLKALTVEGIFYFKDFSAHLNDPLTIRSFREVAQGFARTRSTMVLTGEDVVLPQEIEHKVVRYDLSTPIHNYSHIRTSIHPVWLRCSSVIYLDIMNASRLASRAPRRSRYVTVIMNQGT